VSSVKRRSLEFRECASQPKAHASSDHTHENDSGFRRHVNESP
jgi:hypothetical protein